MEFVSGNVYIREMAFVKAGDTHVGHFHNFDHTTYVVRGAIKIEQLQVVVPAVLDADGIETTPAKFEVVRTMEKKASQGHNWVLILAKAYHRITALEDDTMAHCIYAHRNPQGEVVQEYDGWHDGYA